MNKVLRSFSFAMLALSFTGCGADSQEQSELKSVNASPVLEDANTDALARLRTQYDTSVKTLIDSKCQKCHARIRTLNFADFDSVKKLSADMETAVASGSMPRGLPLSPEDKTTLSTFLKELAALP
ncbi:hypothetical protein EBR21_09745 [bacterium]|nr:hypothetical protein [bacterium]